MPETKVRYGWVDWSKFICISLMILCHTGMQGDDSRGIVAQVIYSFHMPAFFIISGFLFRPHAWWKTLRSFLLPILFFSAIKLVELLVIQYQHTGAICVGALVNINDYWCNRTGHASLFTGQWFLFALLGCRLFMGDIGLFKVLGRYYWIVGPLCLAYVAVDDYFDGDYLFKNTYLYNSLVAMVFFCFGIFLKKREVDFSKVPVGLAAIFLIVGMALCFWNGRIDMSMADYGLNCVLFYVTAIVVSLSLFILTAKCRARSWVTLYSMGTLALLGSHMILYEVIFRILKVFGICYGGYVSVVSTIAIVLLNYPLISFCEKKALWVLGK